MGKWLYEYKIYGHVEEPDEYDTLEDALYRAVSDVDSNRAGPWRITAPDGKVYTDFTDASVWELYERVSGKPYIDPLLRYFGTDSTTA